MPVKYIILLFCIFYFLFPISESFAQISVGVSGGFNNFNVSGDSPDKASYKSRFGFGVNVIGEIKVFNDVFLSIQPGYLQKGTTSDL